MNIWLVTTGSSDVQLTSDGDERWSDWWQEIKNSLYRLPFKPVRAIDDDGEPYRLPARVLSLAYDRLADQVQPYLSFPLLQNFTQKLKTKEIQIDQIIVLISDQENIFPEVERETKRCPYWQDTCQLYPILENYLGKQFPNAIVKPLVLKPQLSEPGLDDWDAVLELVQQEIESLTFETEPQTVYVSHQAGTPAISSAVQFSSLAQFGDRVRFLVSSEQNTKSPEILPSSSYLKGIRKQEAKKLLERHDYSGVKGLLDSDLVDEKDKENKILLEAAIQWNFANFDIKERKKENDEQSSFVDELQKLSNQQLFQELEKRREHWWWIAYEEVYLAVIRKDQGNIVEAFFHSFRAFEYIFAVWSSREFGGEKDHVEEDKGKFYLKKSVLSDGENYFEKAKFKQNGDPRNDLAKLKRRIENEEKVLLDFSTILKLFRACRIEYESDCQAIEIFWDEKNNKENNISEKRNGVFHQIQGMSESDLWSFWGIASSEEWESRLLKFLNFIVKKDFLTLEAASLMVKVHRELESAIANL